MPSYINGTILSVTCSYRYINFLNRENCHLTFTCSKLTIETLGKGMKCVQS